MFDNVALLRTGGSLYLEILSYNGLSLILMLFKFIISKSDVIFNIFRFCLTSYKKLKVLVCFPQFYIDIYSVERELLSGLYESMHLVISV